MIDSFETIEPRFFLIASLMRSLWRSWSIMPFRWSDQSLRWTDIYDYLSLYDIDAPLKEIELKTATGESIHTKNKVDVQAKRRQTIKHRYTGRQFQPGESNRR